MTWQNPSLTKRDLASAVFGANRSQVIPERDEKNHRLLKAHVIEIMEDWAEILIMEIEKTH